MENELYDAFKMNIEKEKLISDNARVLLLNSLGSDSSVLAELLFRLKKDIEFELIMVLYKVPIHVYRDKDYLLIIDYWEKRGVSIEVVKYDFSELEWENEMSFLNDGPCKECRKLRNAKIVRSIEKYKPDIIASGFNLTDLQSYLATMQLLSDYTFDITNISNKDAMDRFISLVPRFFMKISSEKKGKYSWILPLLIFDDEQISNYLEEKNIPFINSECKFKENVCRSKFKEFVKALRVSYNFESSYTNLVDFLKKASENKLNGFINDAWVDV